jgi:integrase
MRISQIRSATIENDFRAQLPHKLLGKSVRNILVVLSRMLESAVEWDYIPANPFHARKKVKLPSLSKEQKGRALSPEEIRKLLASSEGDTYVINATAILTGMRRGEVFGLPWDALDFEKNQINVRQSLFWKQGKYWAEEERGYVLVTPKSKASIRKIDMSPQLRRILLEHRMRHGNPQCGLVFVNREGKPMDPKNFAKRQFKVAVKAAGLGKVRFHDLRHTFGTLKILQGENIKYVQVQMGHSSIRVTLDIYGHLLKDANPKAAAKTDAMIFGERLS